MARRSRAPRFHRQVDVVMTEVVDFDSFARGVMGPYANLQRLPTDVEKMQRRDQIKRFAEIFKHGLIETYAKGLLKFNGQRIETLPPRKGDDAASNAVGVVQNIYGSGDKPYILKQNPTFCKRWAIVLSWHRSSFISIPIPTIHCRATTSTTVPV